MTYLLNWLRPWLSEFAWFRRWHGGKWSRWYINLYLTRNPLWLPQWHRPGCGLWWVEREEHAERERGGV